MSCLHESSRNSIAREVLGGCKPVPGWSEFVQKAHSTLGDIIVYGRLLVGLRLVTYMTNCVWLNLVSSVHCDGAFVTKRVFVLRVKLIS